jgi:hypothetical protein
MKTSDSVVNIFPALVVAQSRISTLEKKTKGYGYNYADLASHGEMLRPILKDNDLFIMQDVKTVNNMASVSTMIGHSSGEWVKSDYLEVPIVQNKKTNVAQEMGVSITYARRYALAAFMFILTGEEDTDGVIQQPRQVPRQNTRATRARENFNNIYHGNMNMEFPT